MKVIVCFNTKGGSGKSSLCLGLADTMHYLGKRVVMVDSDPEQFTISQVAPPHALSSIFPVRAERVTGLNPRDYALAVQRIARSHDRVIIDLPARSEAAEQLAALLIADVVLVPVVPNAPDVRALEVALSKLGAVNERRPRPVRAVIVPTLVKAHRAITREILEALRKASPIKVLDAQIPDSALFAEMTAANSGLNGLKARRADRDRARLALIDVCSAAKLL